MNISDIKAKGPNTCKMIEALKRVTEDEFLEKDKKHSEVNCYVEKCDDFIFDRAEKSCDFFNQVDQRHALIFSSSTNPHQIKKIELINTNKEGKVHGKDCV